MNIIQDEDFQQFVGEQESQFLVPFSDTLADVKHRILVGNEDFGDTLPWGRTHSLFRFRPSELTVMAGVNAHRKSMLCSQIILDLLPHSRAVIASLEMPIVSTAERMTKQAAGADRPSVTYIEDFANWTNGKLWLYDQCDSVEPDRIIGMIHYAANKLDVDYVIIDSLMQLKIAQDDYSKQLEIINALSWCAKRHKIHIILVHHMRKGDSEEKPPSKMEIKGSGGIIDRVDNILICWRNRPKEKLIESGKEAPPKMPPVEEWPDLKLIVEKQRFGKWEGQVPLWFDSDSMCHSGIRGRKYLWRGNEELI